jgi:hypothetical protein
VDDFSEFDYRGIRKFAIIKLIQTISDPMERRPDLDEYDNYDAKLNACDILEEVF